MPQTREDRPPSAGAAESPPPGERDDLAYNRDNEMKPGRPPHSAHMPDGAEDSARNPKTRTDPASGEPLPGAPEPAAADADRLGDLED